MYDQLLPTSKSLGTACKNQCTDTSAPHHVSVPRSRNFSDYIIEEDYRWSLKIIPMMSLKKWYRWCRSLKDNDVTEEYQLCPRWKILMSLKNTMMLMVGQQRGVRGFSWSKAFSRSAVSRSSRSAEARSCDWTMARTVPRSAVPGSTSGAWEAVFSAICVKKKNQRREKKMSVDESTCTRSPGWTTTASKLDILSTAPCYIKLALSSRAHGDTGKCRVTKWETREERRMNMYESMRIWAMHNVLYNEEAVHTRCYWKIPWWFWQSIQ